MLQIGRRIYYELATGNIIVDTGERMGSVIETTVQQDYESYTTLAERVPATVGMIQLYYGQFAQDFATCNGYRVNPTTQVLEFSYPDPNIPPTPPVYQKPLTEEVSELKDQQAIMQLALDDLILSGSAV